VILILKLLSQSNTDKDKKPMKTLKSSSNLSNLYVVSALALVLSVLGSFSFNYLMNEQTKSHYAVLDLEDAIGKTTIKKLQATTNPAEVKKIISDGRNQVEHWLATRLEVHCSAPCVVFNRGDVLFGDVTDLNKMYEIEVLNRKK
jgi:hypothetical protein